MGDNEKSRFCPDCKKTFSRVTNLRHHVKTVHPDKTNIGRKLPQIYNCDVCNKSFGNERYFKNHRKSHEVPIIPSKLLNCPLCEYVTIKSKDMHEHFVKTHAINIKTSMHEFLSYSDFNEWQRIEEQKRKESYVKVRGDVITNDGKVMRYYCHRSGKFMSKSKGLRYLKTQGSNKINAYCPASMKVVMFSDGKCQVTFIETHVGHQHDLGHLSLTSEERASIATKIPLIEILNEVRDSVTKSGLERVHLLNKKDLYNIEQCFNLKSSSKRHQNDAVSVEAWVNEMEASGCILFYKPQGIVKEDHKELKQEDFVLIIMNSAQEEFLKKYGSDCVCADGTHGLNQYDFELTTLLVLDDLREGFPCAFLISNRSDEAMMMLFFNYIKERTGQIISKSFMSDMAPSFYNAWEKVMGPSDNRFYCTWHVDRAFRKNLSKVNSKEKQVSTYKYLRTVLQETDTEAFSAMLTQFLTNLRSDPDTVDFAHYFSEHYANVTSRWAYCYRLHCGINTNMHLERMHRSLKYIYLQGQKVKRLDKGINAIMQFLRDKLFDRLISMKKGKLCTKLRMLRKRHAIGEKLNLNSVMEYNDGWQILSSTTHELYTIQENLKTCDCKITCTICSICIHRYICTCIDSAVKWNMCKHVHLVCRFMKHKGTNLPQINTAKDDDENLYMAIEENSEEMAIQKELKIGQTSALSVEDELSFIRKKINEELDAVKTREEVESLKKLIAPIAPTLAAIRTAAGAVALSASKEKVPHNSKIEPQRRLFSVKKKKSTKKSLEVPRTEDVQKLAIQLIR